MLLSGMILAGGKSSRMGRDKATIEIDGIPIIRHIYDAVAACEDGSNTLSHRLYLVTPFADRYQSILPETCRFIAEPAE